MEVTFYHASPEDVRLPAHPPVAIRDAAARPLPKAVPPPAGAFDRFVNAARNSRIAYQLKGGEAHSRFQADLPPYFTPVAVLAGGGRIVVEGADSWILLGESGQLLERGPRAAGEITLDAPRGAFYVPAPTGYLESHSLSDGRRQFFVTVFFGEQFSRALVQRNGRRFLIVSVEQPAPPHSPVGAHRSVIELGELEEPFEFSDAGRLKTARRLDYLMRRSAWLLPALYDDTLALATDDCLYAADFSLKLQRELTGRFHPLFLSLDEAGRFYLPVRLESGSAFWVVTPDGERVVHAALPAGFEPQSPPVVGFDHTAYLAARNRLLAIDSTGIRWDQVVEAPVAGAAVTPDGHLIVAAGSELLVYDAAGMRRRLFLAPGDVMSTAPSVNEKGDLLVAGHRRLYCLP
jgi:hypothetical protein